MYDTTIQLVSNIFQYQTDDIGEASNREERRIERMIRKTGRDIYRLRKTKMSMAGKQTGDFISFKWGPIDTIPAKSSADSH